MKIIAIANWVLIGLIGLISLHGTTLINPKPDAAGQGVETALFVVAFVVLLILIGMNLLPYTWTKIAALLIELLVLLLIWYLRTH